MYYYDAKLYGISFFDADGKTIYQSAWKSALTYSEVKVHEISLKEGEKIVGIESFHT